MLELLLLAAAAQVQTIRLPPVPPTGVATIKVAPDLVVKEIRIQNDTTMHVLVANIGTGPASQRFPVRATVEIAGQSENVGSNAVDSLPAGGEVWVTLRSDWLTRLTEAKSATAGVDLYPEPEVNSGGGWVPWPTISMPTIPGTKAPCPAPNHCVAESNEENNNYAVAGVPRGTPDRLNVPEAPPATVMVPERG